MPAPDQSSPRWCCLFPSARSHLAPDHRALPRELKNAFERDMLDALRAVGGAIRIYDTQDLYLARKPTGC